MKYVPDYLAKDLKIIFVGFNPSIRSSETGYHFANPNNRFWTILHRAGLTPRKYKPEEDSKLLELGYGMTNIVARPTRAAAEITEVEYETGKHELKHKISHYKPKAVCFVGKGVYEKYCGKRNIAWGLQEQSMVPGVIDFVAPSSSGLVTIKIDDIVDIYRGLTEIEFF